jgi:hypothetical protein
MFGTNKKGLFVILILLVFVLNLKAQKYNLNEHPQAKLNVSGSYYWGVIFKHSSKFLPDVTQKSHAFELAISKVSNGKKEWQKKFNYPEYGAALFMARFGDHDIFGNAYAIIPYIKFWLARKKLVDVYIRPGIGLGYLNKPFDYINNPINNVIGSKINNCTQLSIGADFKVNRELSLFTAMNFTHFSNASFQSPNLGINYLAFSAGFRYQAKTSVGEVNQEPISKPQQKNFFRFNYAMAFYEDRVPRGPKYPIFVFNAAYARATSISNRVYTGINYAFDVGKKEFISQFVYEEKNIKASDLSVFVGNEVFFGRVSLDALIGVYILKAHDSKPPVFAKIGVNYHVLKFGETKEKSLFFGVHMKTHYSVAQYFDVGVGVNL